MLLPKLCFPNETTFHSPLNLQWRRISHPRSKPHIRIIIFCLRRGMTSIIYLSVHHTKTIAIEYKEILSDDVPPRWGKYHFIREENKRSIYKTHKCVRITQVCSFFYTFFLLPSFPSFLFFFINFYGIYCQYWTFWNNQNVV